MNFFSCDFLSSQKGSSNSNIPKSIKTEREFATFSVQSNENFEVFKL